MARPVCIFIHSAPRHSGDRWRQRTLANSTPYEESTKRPVLVGRIRFVIRGLVDRWAKQPTPIAAELKPLQGYWEGEGRGGGKMLP